MDGVHPLLDLAPRDIVSAAITRRLADSPGGVDDHVYLDATHLTTERFRARFPSVYASCTAAGIDPSSQPIPVAPAAHYSCGGLVTTVDGRTSIRGLYAAGETARTGLHGANRLASNSLVEGFVVGVRAALRGRRRSCHRRPASTGRGHPRPCSLRGGRRSLGVATGDDGPRLDRSGCQRSRHHRPHPRHDVRCA